MLGTMLWGPRSTGIYDPNACVPRLWFFPLCFAVRSTDHLWDFSHMQAYQRQSRTVRVERKRNLYSRSCHCFPLLPMAILSCLNFCFDTFWLTLSGTAAYYWLLHSLIYQNSPTHPQHIHPYTWQLREQTGRDIRMSAALFQHLLRWMKMDPVMNCEIKTSTTPLAHTHNSFPWTLTQYFACRLGGKKITTSLQRSHCWLCLQRFLNAIYNM